MKKLVALLLACMLILAAAAAMAEPSGTVMLYSSLKEKQLVAVKEAFEAKYPGIVMDYYQAGTGKIKTKIATEQQAGQVAADLLWVGDASDYLTFKEQGILEAYVSPESEKVPAAYKDEDDLYCGARLVVMGMAYNTQNVTEEEAPKHWKDLLNETFRDQIIMTDPDRVRHDRLSRRRAGEQRSLWLGVLRGSRGDGHRAGQRHLRHA